MYFLEFRIKTFCWISLLHFLLWHGWITASETNDGRNRKPIGPSSSSSPNEDEFLCRTNICIEGGHMMACPSGSVIHIRHMTCVHSGGAFVCPRASYSAAYFCEGESECDASGLRELLPDFCQSKEDNAKDHGVHIHYFCVPESQVDRTCSTGRYHRLKGSFGIIRPPSFNKALLDVSAERSVREKTSNTSSDAAPLVTLIKKDDNTDAIGDGDTNKKTRKKKKKKLSNSRQRCKWLINPGNNVIELKVHQLTSALVTPELYSSTPSSSDSDSGLPSSQLEEKCPVQGLFVMKYKSCSTQNSTTLTWCNGAFVSKEVNDKHRRVPMQIVSCGMIQITTSVVSSNEMEGLQTAIDKLIISYHKQSPSYNGVPSGVSECLPPTPMLVTELPSFKTSFSDDVHFLYDHTEDPATNTTAAVLDLGDSTPVDTNRLYIIVLGIVIGVGVTTIIIVLVCFKQCGGHADLSKRASSRLYIDHRLSRASRGCSDSSERTALWLNPRHDDMQLDTFQTNNIADSSPCTTTGQENNNGVVEALESYESNTINRKSVGSGMFTFQPSPKKESEIDAIFKTPQKNVVTATASLIKPELEANQGTLQVVALVHHEPANRTSGGSDLSSFLAPPEQQSRDSGGLNDLIATFQSGTFGDYSSLNNQTEASEKWEVPGVEYELTDTAPVVVGGAGTESYQGIYDTTPPLYSGVEQGNGSGSGHEVVHSVNGHYQDISGGDNCVVEDGHYQRIGSTDGGHYSSPANGHCFGPTNGVYTSGSGHYDGIGGGSGHYESLSGGGSCHYESLPFTDFNIYEAIDPNTPSVISKRREDQKRFSYPEGQKPTPAPNTNHQTRSPLPPPPPHHTVPNGRPKTTGILDDFHYLINNDEYAVVRKPARQSATISSSSPTHLTHVANGDVVSYTNTNNCNNNTAGHSGNSWGRQSSSLENSYDHIKEKT